MKKLNKITALVVASLLLFAACSDYEGLNADQKGLKNEDLQRDAQDVGAFIPPMMRSIMMISPEWQFQLQQNLNADIYSGYMMSASPFANGNNPQYEMNDGWNGFIVSIPFTNVMSTYLDLEKKEVATRYTDLHAVLKIIKVLSFHRLVDVFGPMPYTQYGSLDAKFDSEQEAYQAFFAELEAAVDTLARYENDDPTFDGRFAPFDASNFGGDYELWAKLGNSLRLRLAMRISNVDPAEAKLQAEAAVNHPFGVIEEGNFEIIHAFNHPLATLSNSWNDILLGAPMESILGGYDDPRLQLYAKPATDETAAGEYKGIRNGVDVGSEKAKYIGYSFLNFESTDAVQLLTAAEGHFHRAEAALNGWNVGGTPQEFYESGIRASFAQYGLNAEEYIASTATPKAYVDTHNDENSVKAGNPNLSTVSVAWDDSFGVDEKREKIITQKWIATFPDGQEAWSEFRRTGYPKLFPVVINKSAGEIANGEFIKRLPYPTTLSSTNPTGVENAVKNHLDGNDSPGQKLWWDVD